MTPSEQGPVLVTGCAGFIGSHLCEALLARGQCVAGVDALTPYYDPALKERNLAAVRAAAERAGGRFVFERADITDAGAMRRVFDAVRPAGVVHLAAKAGVRPSIADPAGYAHTNVVGTATLLAEAARAGCARFVMASSSSVYGNAPAVPFSEGMDVSEPISPYASTKRSCELIGFTHRLLTGMPTACLRFFTVFGPRQRPDLAISTFLRAVSRGEPVPMFGDGSSSRDYTFIADIVRGVLAAYDAIDGHGYRVWNLGGNEPVTLTEMIAVIGRVTGREPRITPGPARAGDVDRTYADLTRSAAELGYAPATRFEDGVATQWAWMRAEGLA